MDKNDVYSIYLISLSRHDFSKFSSSHEIMVEGDAAGLDYIDKVSKRAVEITVHAEWEKSVLKSVSIAQTLGTVGSLWTHTCTL